MEYRRSKKLIKYPRVYLTSAALNSAYENGYKVTFSRHSASYPAYHAFSLDETSSVGWHTDDGSGSTIEYNGTGGAYSGTTRLATETELGEWIGLELPEAIKLMNVNMASQSYSPITHTVDNFIVYAKKQSGDTWTSLGTFTGVAEYQNSAAGVTVNVDTNNYYKFFAIVVTKRYAAAGTDISIRRLDLYGLPEYDPEAHGTDVVLHTTPNVPKLDFSNVYYDGQDYTSMPATVADKSGNGFTGTPSGGVGFDTTYKAFTFDGVDDYIDASVSASFTGNQLYTFSTWIKPDSHPTGYIGIFGIGAATTNNSMGLFLNNGIITHLAHGNNLETGTIAKLGKWVHIAGTYDGTHRTVFMDGERVGRDSYSSLNLTSTTNFKIGSNLAGAQHFNGSIANFRLYNRPLAADEIWELYSYQKEYFGVSPDVVTLKAGRVGIGTSEPRAVLDVRGDIRGGCPVFFQAHATHPSTATTLNAVTNPIPFNTIVHNKGGGLQSSGVFTCPLAGYYYIVWWFMSNLQNQTVYTYLTINGSLELNGTPQSRIYGYSGATGDIHNQVVAGGTVYMNVGDELRFVFAGSTYMYIATTPYNSFTGFYISS
jgi:hypothetical protein